MKILLKYILVHILFLLILQDLYGQIKNDDTDHTIILKHIIDTVPENTEVKLQPGSYILSSIIEIKKNNIKIIGEGVAIVLKSKNNHAQPCVGFYAKRKRNIVFKNIKFIGQNSNNESAIWLENCNSIIIDSCIFTNIGFVAVMLSNELKPKLGFGCKNCKVLNCLFENIFIEGQNLGTSIFLFSDADSNAILNNYIKGAGWVGIAIDDASTYSIPPYLSSKNNIIQNNFISEMKGAGILIEGSSNNIIQNNLIMKSRMGLLLNNTQHYNPSNNNNIKNNVLIDNLWSGITIIGCSYNKFENNWCINNKNHGISIQSTASYPDTIIFSKNNYLFENQLHENSGYGIFISDSSINYNIFDSNLYRNNKKGEINISNKMN